MLSSLKLNEVLERKSFSSSYQLVLTLVLGAQKDSLNDIAVQQLLHVLIVFVTI